MGVADLTYRGKPLVNMEDGSFGVEGEEIRFGVAERALAIANRALLYLQDDREGAEPTTDISLLLEMRRFVRTDFATLFQSVG